MSHTIELKKVSKYYAGEESISLGLSKVNLSLDIGEFVVITGESGSGKSTLLNIISGLDTYDEGEMFINGEDTTGYTIEDYEKYRKDYIGSIFQDFNLINSYDVYQNIELAMLTNGYEKQDCEARVKELTELVGLSEHARTKASKLSGGQKQRLAIARALAKDSPIIVADEPTANLDSESAATVVDTLAKAAKDKLIVVVTHNYPQFESCATRKLILHDGQIMEDIVLEEPETENSVEESNEKPENAEAKNSAEASGEAPTEASSDKIADSKIADARGRRMKSGSVVALGIRNAFNVPSKFILLVLIYSFVALAILSQYASVKNSQHERELLGTNYYFKNSSVSRIIVSKQDGKNFTDKDIEKINKLDNVDEVIENDVLYDELGEISFEYVNNKVIFTKLDELKKGALSCGRMPKNKYEAVIELDPSCAAYTLVKEKPQKFLDEKIDLYDSDENKMNSKSVKICGIILRGKKAAASNSSNAGNGKLYIYDELANEMTASIMAKVSRLKVNYGGMKTETIIDQQFVFPNSRLLPGYVSVGESVAENFSGQALGKTLKLTFSNQYFSGEKNFKVASVFSSKNSMKLLNVYPKEANENSNAIYISSKDYNELFARGNFQISVLMADEKRSQDTVDALNKAGFDSLVLKDTLSYDSIDEEDSINFVTYTKLLLEFLLLIIISYGVINIILKSRRSYYSVVRSLGASKGNIRRLLRVELSVDMLIATIFNLGLTMLIERGIIDAPKLKVLLFYIEPLDFLILIALLLVITYIIAARYAGRIFSKSVMLNKREVA